MVGRTVSHYQILEKLGEGGMGVVYKALDTHLDRLVALKVLPPEKVADAERKRRFVQEAKAASALNHPNIVTIYDIDSADGIDFIAMELVAGKTLDRCIPRNGLRLNEALKYSVQVADAVGAAHKAGIVHRDMKPSNVMVTEQGLVKVLDFGVAKLTEPNPCCEGETTRTLKPTTEEGTIVGTASYMSPEQAEGKKVDGRSDIFSFGALVYEMVTGRKAFQRDSQLSTLSAILLEEPKPAGQLVKGLPHELERIVARCLRKNPERRFQAMPDLKIALEELKEESDSGKLGAVMSPKPHRGRLGWTIAFLAVVAAAVGTIWFARSAHTSPEPTLTVAPLTTYPGFQGEPSFSPDGNQVAFSWEGYKQDNLDIYVKLIGTSGPPLRLTTDSLPDYGPAWSPDGRYIAFLRDSQENGAVILIPALGGPERKIGEINKGVSELPGPYLAWSPDGKSLVISDRDSTTGPFALFLLLIETGEKRRLTSPPPTLVGDTSPAFSPDGHTLAFSRRVDFDYGLGDLYTLNLVATSVEPKPAGEVKRITFENRGARSPAWTSHGREIVFSDRLGVWRISTSASTAPRQLSSLGGNVSTLGISRDGQRLTYVRNLFHSNLRRLIAPIVDGDRGHGLPSHGSAVTFISSTRDDSSPQYSRDGKKIAFISDRSGNPEVWSSDSDGSNALQLTSFSGPQVTTPRWSPDGSRIAFDSNAEGEYDIWVIGADGGRPQRMTTHPANDGNPSWSPDGRWIYFDSARSSQQQVWKMPANGGEPIQITRDGGFAPLVSQDGKFLYYLKGLADSDVWRMPTDGAQGTRVLEGLSDYRNLAVVENGLMFVPTRNTSSLEFLNFVTGKITLLAKLDRPIALGPLSGLALSPDRRSILYTEMEQAGSELMLVEKFR